MRRRKSVRVGGVAPASVPGTEGFPGPRRSPWPRPCFAPLGALLLLPGCAATIVHSKPGPQELFAGSQADLHFAALPILEVADDPHLVGSLWLTPICAGLGLADLPLSFAFDLLACVPGALRPLTRLPRALGRDSSPDEADR